MEQKDFYSLVYEEYKSELNLAYSLYQRAGVAVTGIVLIGGASASLTPLDSLWKAGWHPCAVMSFCFAIGVSTLLVVATAFVLFSAFPRDYPKLNKMFFWNRWRHEYAEILTADDRSATERNRQALAEASLDRITLALSDAQSEAAHLNQIRLRYFQRVIFLLAISLVMLMLQYISQVPARINGERNDATHVVGDAVRSPSTAATAITATKRSGNN